MLNEGLRLQREEHLIILHSQATETGWAAGALCGSLLPGSPIAPHFQGEHRLGALLEWLLEIATRFLCM